MDKIAILDFGGQYCHMISRRVRELGVFTEVLPHSISAEEIRKDANIKGIIISGGANSVYEDNAPQFDHKILNLGIPLLGICYGHQLIVHALKGKVATSTNGEYGPAALTCKNGVLFCNLKPEQQVWMNHRDVVTKLPTGFLTVATTEHSAVAAYENIDKKIFGVQFHPEVTHTKKGQKMLRQFVIGVCRCRRSWTLQSLEKNIIAETRATIGDKKAIIGLSGGIDSSVAAILTGTAIHNNLIAVYVDTGLMRYGETATIRRIFKDIKVDLRIVEAHKEFFTALKGVSEPEQKRKIIGKLFVDIFEKIARAEKADFLIQGTIYSDRIESGITKNSSTIKSHHNVGGLPKDLKLSLYEPLRDLYKDEVRKLAKSITLPPEITTQQVFPGPGLAVRIVGEVTREKAETVRQAGRIIEEELRNTKYWKKIWMSFAVLLPVKSVGIQGDERSYKNPIVLRIIESRDAMTATYSHIPHSFLTRISTRITNEIKEVNRVVYDITNKPPATMEWE